MGYIDKKSDVAPRYPQQLALISHYFAWCKKLATLFTQSTNSSGDLKDDCTGACSQPTGLSQTAPARKEK